MKGEAVQSSGWRSDLTGFCLGSVLSSWLGKDHGAGVGREQGVSGGQIRERQVQLLGYSRLETLTEGQGSEKPQSQHHLLI